MAQTRHGHHIPGSPADEKQGALDCGGPLKCSECQRDCISYREAPQKEESARVDVANEDFHFSGPYDVFRVCNHCGLVRASSVENCPGVCVSKDATDGGEYCDENTLVKVQYAIESVLGRLGRTTDVINALQNAGILFRERR